eukprot:SAG22_NODE_2046_length_3086_cov_3.806495_3_plen_418_part_00
MLLWLLPRLAVLVLLALAGSGAAAAAKRAALADACFRSACLLGFPVALATHLLSSYYGLAPRWLEPAFHRWRVRRYFTPGSSPHTKSRLREAAESGRPYRALELPPCGRLVHWDFRPRHARAKERPQQRPLRVVNWNLEFGYRLGPIIEELRRLEPDVLCLQEVDVHADTARRVSVDVGREIAEALGLAGVWAGHHCYADANGDGGTWGCAVLSRFGIVADSVPGAAAFLELPCLDGYPRGAVMCTVRCGGAIGALRVVSMHTEVCCSPEVRLQQLAAVCRHPFVSGDRDAAGPCVVAGDMNTIGGHIMIRISPIHGGTHPPWLKRWRDGWWDALLGAPAKESEWWQQHGLHKAAPGFVDCDHPKLTSTLGYSWPVDVRAKLDWLLLRGGGVRSVRCSVGTGTESDHHWIMAELVRE